MEYTKFIREDRIRNKPTHQPRKSSAKNKERLVLSVFFYVDNPDDMAAYDWLVKRYPSSLRKGLPNLTEFMRDVVGREISKEAEE